MSAAINKFKTVQHLVARVGDYLADLGQLRDTGCHHMLVLNLLQTLRKVSCVAISGAEEESKINFRISCLFQNTDHNLQKF